MNPWKFIWIFVACTAVLSCSTTRSLPEGQYRLAGSKIVMEGQRGTFRPSELNSYVRQKPNSTFLGINPLLNIYDWAGPDDSKASTRLIRKFGVAPVILDTTLVLRSIDNMASHLEYIGYYGSKFRSQVEYRDKKAYVTYFVRLGQQYTIRSLAFELPDSEEFKSAFDADLNNISLKEGQVLSESSLEAETERSAQFFRNRGYYGFDKNYYFFEADTLSHDGTAALTMAIRDYRRTETPDQAAPHLPYRIGNVTISHPDDIQIRPSVLENLNTLRPGQPYSERDVNTTYSRIGNLSVFNSINIAMNPVSEDVVDCAISLQNTSIQGFKANFETSVNSTGLYGVSPQLNYYHKNIFHGGEILNLGLKGNFQFRPSDNVRSTEVTTTASLRVPMFVGMPNRTFRGPNLPHTDINLAFSYQDRPEYKRTMISTSFGYIGNLGRNFFYQFYPFQANVTRLFSIDEEFLVNLLSDPFMLAAYSSHFDMGIGGMLYYTTDPSAIPSRPYHYYRLGFDLSGNVLSLFNPLMKQNEWGERTIWNTPYSQYVRAEWQMGKTFRFGINDSQTLALRFLAGAGYAYGNSSSVPFEKQFYAGGANSMRGWQARTLGPGSSPLIDFFTIPSQIGDMKLEANIEYRFPIVWKLEGATFIDAGNIWSLTSENKNERFSFDSIAADWGIGIRVNLDFILVRIDMGMKVFEPSREPDERLIGPADWLKRGNHAIHFGVGYPF